MIDWESLKILRLKFDNIFFTDKKTLLLKKFKFEEKKFKIRCLWIWLNFIESLIEFMEGLIARKIDFKSIWALIWRN